MNGLKFLLDTNIVIGLLKGNVKAIDLAEAVAIDLAEAVALDLSVSAVSQITRMELCGFSGMTEAEESRIKQFFQACNVLLIDERAEQETIRLRKVMSLKLPDVIVAATLLMRLPFLFLWRFRPSPE
ncbi:type II toxin-antitoxin system VapC family toxin [Thiomicrospira microaerophila]|uniref:type II toxin-antitoxin system VapC family toxin n=1 Tax=Thiomicrospira microaerophila TaxID=406020 RepID=UPI0006987685|nr:type II toxin-antitoxin system VapC family toxin [Thiomicrospira microaerophila]